MGFFDFLSFVLGMITATLIWWLLPITRPLVERLYKSVTDNKKYFTKNNSDVLDNVYRGVVFKQTRSMHLAASLFPLEEIVEIPRLLAPPAVYKPNEPHHHLSVAEKTLPYIRNYPELGLFYSAPTLTIGQAISGGKHLAIVGQPGTGKSTALAYLASQITSPLPTDRSLQKYIPFLLHVADLKLPITNAKKPIDFLVPLILKISRGIGFFYKSRLPSFIENACKTGAALLLLDGIDELSQSSIREVIEYLRIFQLHYPKTSIVVTASPEFLDGLIFLDFVPMAIMPWTDEQCVHFLKNWTVQWQKYVISQSWASETKIASNFTLLNRWLGFDNLNLTPLEYTLKVWGGYAGDIRSTRNPDLIEAHIRRLTPAGISAGDLSNLGMYLVLNETPVFDDKKQREGPGKNNVNNPVELWNNPGSWLGSDKISSLIDSGLLLSHDGNMVRFCHPIFQGFLAGRQLAETLSITASLLKQPAWSGQTTSLRYMAFHGDVSSLAQALLEKDDPILFRPQLLAGRLLRDANTSNNPWRNIVMTKLVQILQDDDNPVGLRGEALVALVLSGDSNIGPLFRKLIQAPSNELRQLASLGSGMLRDTQAVDFLKNLVDNSLESTRQAAVLALVEIGSRTALESVATYLLSGDDQLRIYSAEAFANHKTEGKSVLLDGITSEDILVRRASVYGLSCIHESWSTELLERVQVNDEQWAVRNVAVESLKMFQHPDPRIPKKLPLPIDNPWLLEFAGKYGLEVIADQPATDILLLALKNSNKDYFLPALDYLRFTPTEAVLSTLYPFLKGTDGELKEAVYQTLLIFSLSGTTLPRLQHFGLG